MRSGSNIRLILEKHLEPAISFQHLEELLNDTIELNQAEIVGLKNELQSLTKRMEYHYNDKMTELRETIEALQNRVTFVLMIRSNTSLQLLR